MQFDNIFNQSRFSDAKESLRQIAKESDNIGISAEEVKNKNFDTMNKKYSHAKRIRFKYIAFFHSNIELCNNLLSLLVLAAGGYFIMKGKMTLPDLVAANLFIASFPTSYRAI